LLLRSEWLRRIFRLRRVSERDTDAPPGPGSGLLLIQVDGLAHRQLERALSQGKMPFLRRLIERENYHLLPAYSGLPSTTPAVQGELHYGVPCAVPAFAYLDRQRQDFAILYEPESAQAVEEELRRAGGEPLLKGGSSWSNIFSGGAGEQECHFCSINLSLRKMLAGISAMRMLAIVVLYFPALIHVLIA
jgi:hypothetical protein